MTKILTIKEYPFEDGEWAFYSGTIRKKYGWKGGTNSFGVMFGVLGLVHKYVNLLLKELA